MWRWRRHVESGVLGHHALETDAHALDDGEQNGATNGTVAHGLVATTDGKSTTSEETGNDGVPGVFLLAVGELAGRRLRRAAGETVPNALHRTVKGAKHATPDTKVTTQDGGTRLDGGQSAYPSLSIAVASSLSMLFLVVCSCEGAAQNVRTVPEALDTVPERTTDCAHAESTSEIVQGPVEVEVSGPMAIAGGSRKRTPKGRGLWCDP